MNELKLFKKYIKYISIFFILFFVFILFFGMNVGSNNNSLMYSYFTIPFDDNANYVITSEFGYRVDPIDKTKIKFHSGVDLATSDGTKILSSANGIVYETGKSESLGNYVFIMHDFKDRKLCSMYGHLLDDSIVVKKDEVVFQKQEIATIGSTGRSTGTHLHFSISKDMCSFNPIDLLNPINVIK